MDWKKFFKINWIKVGITAVVTLILILFTKIPAFVTMRIGPSRFQFVDYTYFLSHFSKMFYFDFEILTLLFIILEIVVVYVIACLIYTKTAK